VSDARLRELERRWLETQAVQDEAAYLLERVRVGDLERENLALAAMFGHGASGVGLTGDVLLHDYGRLRETSLDDQTLARLAHASCLAALTDDRLSLPVQAGLRRIVTACERFVESGVRVSAGPGFFDDVPSHGLAFRCLQDALDSLGFQHGWERVAAQVVPWLLGCGDPIRERVESRRGKPLELGDVIVCQSDAFSLDPPVENGVTYDLPLGDDLAAALASEIVQRGEGWDVGEPIREDYGTVLLCRFDTQTYCVTVQWVPIRGGDNFWAISFHHARGFWGVLLRRPVNYEQLAHLKSVVFQIVQASPSRFVRPEWLLDAAFDEEV
jgi:hypothetical protein